MIVWFATRLEEDAPHLAVVVDAGSSPRIGLARSVHIKAFPDHLFALLPKCLGALRIEGVSPHTAAQAGHGNHLGDVTVFAIAAANRLSIGGTGGPHCSCRTLGNALIAERGSALGLTGIDLHDQFRHRLRRY